MYDLIMTYLPEIITVVVVIILNGLSYLLCWIKIKHSQLHQETETEDDSDELNLSDYSVLINGTYYKLSDLTIIKNDDK